MGKHPKIYEIDRFTWWTIISIIFLFSFAIGITLSAPRHIDPTWTQPTSPYQVQMYEMQDPNQYISSASTEGRALEYVDCLQRGVSLSAFVETETVRIIAPPVLSRFITHFGDKELKLTSQLLLLRDIEEASVEEGYDPKVLAEEIWQSPVDSLRIAHKIYELYDPQKEEAFALVHQDGVFANWVDRDFVILDKRQVGEQEKGTIYVKNPVEFRYMLSQFGQEGKWRYSPMGKAVSSLKELQAAPLYFHSKQELIAEGEHLFAIEGCWYCHTDQSRTLPQDLVLNGSPEYPAPPSSPNEYIYQKITFPGTRRIGPDLSRVAIKRPSRDWHMSHFWSPSGESPGSIMPSFQHFFDKDPRGAMNVVAGIPNYRFESIFQYLMTKGSRITSPAEAWWEGRDPVNTLGIIEGEKEWEVP